MAEITGTKDLSPSSLASTSDSEPFGTVTLSSGISSKAVNIPEPSFILTQKEAAILLGWRAASYAAGSGAGERLVLIDQWASIRTQRIAAATLDQPERDLEQRLIVFEGGNFSSTNRQYIPKSFGD